MTKNMLTRVIPLQTYLYIYLFVCLFVDHLPLIFFDLPYIRIEHLDEFGRPMTLKEAFRAQSYKFHGKKPGKNRQEKKLKQLEIEKRKYGTPSLPSRFYYSMKKY